MYKISKLKADKLLNRLVNVPKQNIMSPATSFDNFSKQEYQRMNYYHVYGERSASAAFFYLNRPQKYNTLSSKMCGEIKRFLESYDLDETVRGIWMESKDKEFFSAGTNFLQLSHHIRKGEDHKAYDYLRDVNDLGITLGKFNKPLVTNINGVINNSAASMFSVLPHTLAGNKTKWSLNETRLGYIPDCGASYYLSRLPGEIGVYLALTGAPLSGEDLVHLKIAYLGIHGNPEIIRQQFAEANNESLEPLNSKEMFGAERLNLRDQKRKVIDNTNRVFSQEIKKRIDENGENAKLVLSEVAYKKRMIELVNQNFSEGDTLEYKPQRVVNHMDYYENQILTPVMLNLTPNHDRFEPNLNIEAINRCFSGGTLEEIFELLRKENTEWAKETLEILQSKSPLTLKITLKLIREGLKSQWADCYAREFRVACRRIRDEEFHQAVEKVIYNRDGPFRDWKHKNPESVSEAQVDSYFQPFEQDLKIPELQHGVLDHSLYPTKDFYKNYPDLVRFFLNEQSVNNPYRREEGDFTVKEFLIAKGIDFRNHSASVDKIRKHFYLVEQQKRKLELEKERISEICTSGKNIKNYLEARKAIIDAKFSDENEIKTQVQGTINKIFENFLVERLDKFREASRDLQNEEKKKFFIDVKKMLQSSRLTYTTQERLDNLEQLRENKQLPLFFPEDNTKSFISEPNPNFKQHPLSETISLIKRKIRHNPMNSGDKVYEEDRYTIEFDREKLLGKNKANNDEILVLNTEREEYPGEAQKIVEQKLLYGVTKDEREFMHYYTDRLINAGNAHDSIKKFISEYNSKDIEGFIKESQIETIGQNRAEFVQALDKRNEATSQFFEGKEEDKFKDIRKSALDFYDKRDQSGASLWGALDLTTKENKLKIDEGLARSEENLELQLLNFIKTDQNLETLLSLFFQPKQEKPVERIRKTFVSLLLNVYSDRIKRSLKSESAQGLISPLLTRNGKGQLSSKETHNYMRLIDDYLQRSVSNEFHRMIAGQLFFSFGYLGLLELERIFQLFQRATNLTGSASGGNDDLTGHEAQLLNFLRINKIELSGLSDLEPVLNYLNDLTEKCAALFYLFKDELHSPEERILELLGNSEVLQRRRFRRTFVQHALESFQDKLFLESEREKKIVEKYTLQKEPMKIENVTNVLNNKKDDYYGNLEHFEREAEHSVKLFEAYKEKKNLIEGSVLYLRKLDKLSLRAIKGELNFVPEKDLVNEELAQIPNFFNEFDSRKPVSKWFDERLERYLRSIFEVRFAVEKNLPKNELLALDYEIIKYLDVDRLKTAMLNELEQDMSIIRFLGELLEREGLARRDYIYQESKYDHYAKHFEENIKNPEALNKLLAFGMMLHHKYNVEKTEEDVGVIFNEMEIMKNLEDEVFQRPSPIVETDEEVQKYYKEFFQIDKLEKANQDQNQKFLDMKKSTETPYREEIGLVLKNLMKEKEASNIKNDTLKAELDNFFMRFADSI